MGQSIGCTGRKLITSDKFHSQVVEYEKLVVEELAREERRSNGRWDEQTEAMGPWKEVEAARLLRNRVRRQAFKDRLVTWEGEGLGKGR